MSSNKEDSLQEKSVYSVRIRNLVGIFGMLLLFNVITFSPYIIASVIGLIVGLEKIPPAIYTTVLILFLLNNVTNSIIQSYFRRDLRDVIIKSINIITRPCAKLNSNDTNGNNSRNQSSENTLHNGSRNQTCDSKREVSESVNISLESQTTMHVETKEAQSTVSGVN